MADQKEQATYFIEKGKLFKKYPNLEARQITHISRFHPYVEEYDEPFEVRINGDTVELWLSDELDREWGISPDGDLDGITHPSHHKHAEVFADTEGDAWKGTIRRDKEEGAKYFIRKGKLFEDDPELGVRQVTRINRMETFLSNVGASGPLEVRVNGDTIELWLFDELGYELSIGSDGELRENVDGESPYYSIHTDYEEKEEDEDENEAEYYIQNEKLLEYHPKLGVRQLTHIKRLHEMGTLGRGEGLKRGELSGSSEVRVNGNTIEIWLLEIGCWWGSLEVRVNEDTIELWLDEHFDGEDDHEASYDKLCHELTIGDDGEFRGTVDNGYLYVFVFKDNKGVITEDFGNGNHLGERKYERPPNPLLGRLMTLLGVGYVIDNSYGRRTVTINPPHSVQSYNYRDVEEALLKHPSNIGFLKLELLRDGGLRRPEWEDHEDEFYIAPEDREGFSKFIRSVRVPTVMDKILPSG